MTFITPIAERAEARALQGETSLQWDVHNGWSYESPNGLGYEPDGSFWSASSVPWVPCPGGHCRPGWEVRNNRRNVGAFCVIAPHMPI